MNKFLSYLLWHIYYDISIMRHFEISIRSDEKYFKSIYIFLIPFLLNDIIDNQFKLFFGFFHFL